MTPEYIARLQEHVAAQAHRTFQAHSSSEDLCTATVDLHGGLVDVVFLRRDVFGFETEEAIAAEVLATILRARDEAAAALAEIITELGPPPMPEGSIPPM